ncbi:MAG: CHAT domain-containing protein [Scytolyngbya sp. HA4215-MV1]|nr:CHAT domain-containing protein [Scytolyngbya sp. HA4215-MV1]
MVIFRTLLTQFSQLLQFLVAWGVARCRLGWRPQRGTQSRSYWQTIALGLCVTFFTIVISSNCPSIATQRPSDASTRATQPLPQSLVTDPLQLVQSGKASYQAEQFAAAAATWQQASEQLANRGDRLNQAIVLSNLALAYQQLGRWTEANQAIATSLNFLNSPDLATASKPQTANLQVQTLLAQAFNIQGSLLLAQGKSQLALETWQKATQIYQTLGDMVGISRTLINQTQALRALGLYTRSRKTLETVQQTLQNQPDSLLKAASLLNLGDSLRLVGDFKQSQTVLQQSLTIAQTLQSPTDIAAALVSQGNTARAQSQTAEALQFYQQAIAIAPSASFRVRAQLNHLRLLIETAQWSQAQSLISPLQAQLDRLPLSRTTIYAQVNFAESLMKMGRTANRPQSSWVPLRLPAQILVNAVQQSQTLADPIAESYALGYLGELYEKNAQWTDAQTATEKALMLAQFSNAPDIAYRWQWQLGRLLKQQGQQPEAIVAYTEAVNTLRSIRNDLIATNLDVQFSFRESVEPVYRQLVGLLLQPAAVAQTKENIEPSKTSQENLKKAREVLESLQLAELDNFFRESCLTGQATQVDQIDASAAILYTILLEDRLEVVLSVPGQPLRHYSAPVPQSQMDGLAEKMRRSFRRAALQQEQRTIAQKLYDLLIRPAEADLAANQIKTLTFVLDGSLKNLPMAALYDGQQYLIEKYGVAVTPGLKLLSPRPLEKRQLRVLVAGLSEARQGFSSLPGVEQEVQDIRSEIPTEVLLNQGFTGTTLEKRINGAQFSIVHLATHGQFSSNAAETFVLAWDSRINVKKLGEMLQSRDQQVRVPIELLVLSACQTADGDRRAALGLAGVAVRSGARSTLATLWPVDDRSTSSLMVQFYQHLTQPNTTRAEALRQAQITLLKQPNFRHPFYWAPFILVGNWL